jgi:hypothetical protein
VGATPRGILKDLYLVGGGAVLKILCIVSQAGKVLRFDVVEGVGQSHFTMPMMVSVGFTVGSDVDKFVPVSLLAEDTEKSICKILSLSE